MRKLVFKVRDEEKKNDIRIVDISDRTVRLSQDVHVDVNELLAATGREPLSRIYRGPFADDVTADHPGWTAWLEAERERFRTLYVEKAAASLTDPDLGRVGVSREIKRLLEVDPGNETAMRAQMIADAIVGDLDAMRRSYDGLQDRLRGSGAHPETRTTHLFTRLLAPKPGDAAGGERGRDPGIPTICLLPPVGEELSVGSKLAKSLVADVSIGLGRNSFLKIVAPCTAAKIKGIGEAERLGPIPISYLVTTELLDHVLGSQQVVCSLIALPTRRVLWSDRIAAADPKLVENYNVLTAGVLRSVMQHVDRAEIEAYALDADPSSYSEFLAGHGSLASLDLRELRRGRQRLRRAADQSPDFAPALSALARSYQLEWILTARGDDDLLDRSEHYARAAIAADPYEARGFRELGFCSLYRKQFDRSIGQYETAERLNPNHADIIAEYADALIHDGQPLASLDKIKKAIELNPLCQDTYFWAMGSANFFLERYDDAVDALMRMTDVSPVYRLLAAVHALGGDKEEANRCRVKAMAIHPKMNLEEWINIVPFRDPRQIQHYREGLRSAGFR